MAEDGPRMAKDGHEKPWRAMENLGGPWNPIEGHLIPLNTIEGHGGSWNTINGYRLPLMLLNTIDGHVLHFGPLRAIGNH